MWEELPAYGMIIFGSTAVGISSFVAHLMLHKGKINRFFYPLFSMALIIAISFSLGVFTALWYVVSQEIIFKWVSLGFILAGSAGLVFILILIIFLKSIIVKEDEYLPFKCC